MPSLFIARKLKGAKVETNQLPTGIATEEEEIWTKMRKCIYGESKRTILL